MTRRSLVSVLLLSALGCARSNLSTIEFGAICYPTDDCKFSSTCDNVDMSGQLWVDLRYMIAQGYLASLEYPIEIFNQRADNASGAGGVNTNDATIDRFEMRYVASGKTIATAASIQTVTVPVDGSTVAMVFLIPRDPSASAASATLAALPAGTLVTVMLKAHGHYQDETSFETGEYPVPVELDNGLFPGSYSCIDATKKVKNICPTNPGQSVNVVCG